MKNTYNLFLLFLVFVMPQNIQAQQLDHILGDLLIQIPLGESPDDLIEDLKYFNNNVTHLKTERTLRSDFNIWLLHFDYNQINEISFLNHIRNHRLIEFAQFNHILSERQTVPDDPQFSQQWQWLNDGSGGGVFDADVDADLAWDITTGGMTAQGDEIVVCVMEGANRDHADLLDNLWLNVNEIPNDGIDNDNNGYIDDIEGWNNAQNDGEIPGSGHGTQVSGMIGAVGNNTLGVTGINWNVKIMYVAVGSLNDANVMEAYNYPLIMRRMYNESGGTEGAFIVVTNASWGIDFGQPEDAPLWCNMYDILGSEGILNCGATANNNVNIDVVGDLPTTCPSDFMVSVTATNNQDLRTFSAYGLINVDVGAPGSAIFTLNGSGGYSSTSGTSFASPLTAGVIALLYSAPCSNIGVQALEDPQGAALLIRDYLYEGVDETPQLLLETSTGGRVNAFNSLQLLLGNCGACPTPYSLNSANLTDTSAVLSWFESDSILVSDLRYKPVGDTTWIEINDVSAPFELTGLVGCDDYEFQVAATCSDTATGYSNSHFFSTEGCCLAPENINIEPVSVDEILLSWDSIYGALGYIIEYKAESDLGSTILQVNNSSAAITNLSACTIYQFELATVCTPDSTSEYSDTIFYTTECPCGVPENIDTIDVMIENATIAWDAALYGENYIIRYRKFGLIDWIFDETTDVFLTLNSLQGCTIYQYQIQTICPIGNSNFSGSKIFKTACPVGIDEIEGVSGLVIYPNPVINELLIGFDLETQKDISIQLFNTAGQLLKSTFFKNTIQGNNQLEIKNLGDLPKGLYFVKISSEDQTILKKIIKK
jgi:subtilisin family serine protease